MHGDVAFWHFGRMFVKKGLQQKPRRVYMSWQDHHLKISEDGSKKLTYVSNYERENQGSQFKQYQDYQGMIAAGSPVYPTINIFQLLLAFFSDESAGSAGSAGSSACQACQSITSKLAMVMACSNCTSKYSMCSWISANKDLKVHVLACEILGVWSVIFGQHSWLQPAMPGEQQLKAHLSLARCPHPAHWQTDSMSQISQNCSKPWCAYEYANMTWIEEHQQTDQCLNDLWIAVLVVQKY